MHSRRAFLTTTAAATAVLFAPRLAAAQTQPAQPAPFQPLPAPPALSGTLEPAFAPATVARTQEAFDVYRTIAGQGPMPQMPGGAQLLRALQQPNARMPQVAILKERLVRFGDLRQNEVGEADVLDSAAAAALRRFQARHGLSETGAVGPLTIAALNVAPQRRLQSLEATLERLRVVAAVEMPRRHVVVNIPGAALEAVADGRVERRHRAVAGRRDRPSPVIATRLTTVNLNPTWTIPRSIATADIVPRLRREPDFLARSNMRFITFSAPGVAQEIDPGMAEVFGGPITDWWIRQNPGPANALGQVRIDMPNAHDVFMHDTPQRNLFRNDVRFNSSGCVRVENVRDFAAWLLEGAGYDRRRIDREIATNERRDVRIPGSVPVVWAYMTGWGASDGTIQFRDDIYNLDNRAGIAQSSVSFTGGGQPRPAPRPQQRDRRERRETVPQADGDALPAEPRRREGPRPAAPAPAPREFDPRRIPDRVI